MADQRRPDRRPRPAALQPGVHRNGGREQRGSRGRRIGERLFGDLHLALLIEIRRHDPLMQRERMTRGVEDRAAVDDAQRAIHAQPQAFEDGGEMPGVDRLAVDGGLAAHGVEADGVEESRPQRMAFQGLIEAGEGSCGVFERAGESGGGREGFSCSWRDKVVQHHDGRLPSFCFRRREAHASTGRAVTTMAG